VTAMQKILLIHGGAGWWSENRLAIALEKIKGIAERTQKYLRDYDSLDLVELSIRELEKEPVFNAGRGAAFNVLGEVELDAGLMTGKREIGAVANVHNVLHPIALARKIMEETDHVLLSGYGADLLAEYYGLKVSVNDLVTDYVKNKWRKAIQELLQMIENKSEPGPLLSKVLSIYPKLARILEKNPLVLKKLREKYFPVSDTVGAVAFDGENLVAGSSTGGLFLKLPGRIGDTPIPGAGFYAENNAGACVATGMGEQIIRAFLSKEAVDNAAEYGATKAVAEVFKHIHEKIHAGIILVDSYGNWGVYHTSEYFPVAVITEKEIIVKGKWV